MTRGLLTDGNRVAHDLVTPAGKVTEDSDDMQDIKLSHCVRLSAIPRFQSLLQTQHRLKNMATVNNLLGFLILNPNRLFTVKPSRLRLSVLTIKFN